MSVSIRTACFLALSSLGLLLAPLCVPAQQTLADADWSERELGAGVVWRQYLFDDLFDSMQSVSWIDVDLSHPDVSIEIPYLVTGRQLTSAMIPGQFPPSVAGINGTYFDTSVGGHRTYLRIDGAEIPSADELFSPWGYEGALALDASDEASIVEMPSGGWALDTVHPDIIACGPLLIVDGVIPTAELQAIGSHSTSRHPRSAVGITSDDRLILITVDGRTELAVGMTCEELAQVMEQLGCTDALNLDGGGSTTLWGAGELHGGVLNFPSDNGTYDHEGERSCTNAIAIESSAPSSAAWDGRLTDKTFSPLMDTGSQQTATLIYENIGLGTWTAGDTRLVLARPASRTSVFHDTATWPSPSQPALMSPASVAPGETATFTFALQAPTLSATAVYDEHFMLTQAGIGRIGPADSEAWMRVTVQTPVSPGETFIVESRSGGQNNGWYSDSGMADSGANCIAPGCTGDIGMRYGSTYRSVAGAKSATVAPDFPEAADYRVYVAWGSGSSRRSPITYHVNHSGGTDTFQIDQTAVANVWVPLGTEAYHFDAGLSGSVVMTNEDIDVSGSMYAGAVMFEYQPPEPPDRSHVVHHLGSEDPLPVIDGVVGAGEWDAASPAASGYVAHDNPALPAVEDGSFRMLFDETDLFILFQMNNTYLAGYTSPPSPPDYFNLVGDKINFFLTPFGVDSDPFYRILFCPNPTDGTCPTWSQASAVRTTDAHVGTDWIAAMEVSHSHTLGVLTIECRIPWSEFDYPGMSIAGRPGDGDVWGVQPAISNELGPGEWEYVNWEPDDTPTYVHGNPFGALEFEIDESGVSGSTLR
ncbi:phosphodiester glycosidase family protein [Candidatus Sumerlaeota bacterium]|nr:phosphodiester glycosidase family protein [Candidatus Sumerlaeota bacterium]